MTILALVIVEIYASKERGQFQPPTQSYKISKKPSLNRVKPKHVYTFTVSPDLEVEAQSH